MAKTIGEALRILQRLSDIQITDIRMDDSNIINYRVNHRYKETIIIPYVAISSNVSFLVSKGTKFIITADDIRCKVQSYEEKHICELEEDIQKIYGIDTWSFIKRWYKADKNMQSMYFIKIKLIKEESDNG